MSQFKIVKVNAGPEMAEWEAQAKIARDHGMEAPKKSKAVQLHGREVEVLGVWKGPESMYAAVRPIGGSKYQYDLINPAYV